MARIKTRTAVVADAAADAIPSDEERAAVRLVLDSLDPTTGVELSDTVRDEWTIESIGAAEWAMLKVAEHEEVAAEYDYMAKHWAGQATKARRAAEFLIGKLKQWAVTNRTENRKTFTLARGTVSTRSASERMKLYDDSAALEWARTFAPDAICTTEYVTLGSLVDAAGAAIVDVIEHITAIHADTGETHSEIVAPPLVDTPENRARFESDGWDVNFDIGRAVATPDGNLIAGMTVEPERTTATVKPMI